MTKTVSSRPLLHQGVGEREIVQADERVVFVRADAHSSSF